MTRRLATTAVAILALLIVAGGYLLFRDGSGTRSVTAEFSRLVAVYEGSSVRILGVPVGKVTKITPHGSSVTVEMSYDAKYDVPQNATAAVIAPAIVGDRYVQLGPAYIDGPVLPDNAQIPVERTEVPVELDQIFTSVDELNRALGPEGANAQGALSRLIEVGAENLGNGNGQRLHNALHDVSTLVATLDDSKDELVGVINHLGGFTTMLAQDDANVRRVNQSLAAVASQLADDREELSIAVENLSIALGEINKLVKDNRRNLTANIKQLASITDTVVSQKRNLTEFLDVAPLALMNLRDAFDYDSNSLATRGNFNVAHDPFTELLNAICNNLGPLNGPLEAICDALENQGAQQGGPNKNANRTPAESLADLLVVKP